MTISEKIDHLEKDMEIFNTELKKLKEEYEKECRADIRFTPNEDEEYLFVNSLGEAVISLYNSNSNRDKNRIYYNNAFDICSEVNVQNYIDNVLKVQNRLMQIHEELCPEHIPDWRNKDEDKAYVFYDYSGGVWSWTASNWRNENVVVFPVSVMNTVVKILNDEKFMYKERK